MPTTVNELRDRGITVVSLTENFDLSTKEGRFMFAVLAAAAEYELELRAEQQAEGIAAAKRPRNHRPCCPARRRAAAPAPSALRNWPRCAAWSTSGRACLRGLTEWERQGGEVRIGRLEQKVGWPGYAG
ncbi:resolvase-like protein [Nonomuraea fuscirosea]|uniref:Resolvase-like protein n=1 Tax=Nonomuraea fuscirosea TaxID=1291556 RepID=A0A2T0LMR4_9ACTN|nr:resolvase-like protein [Nonomuraea fuscirosea]